METYYDWWLKSEKAKIHNEFEKKKEQLLLKSLDAGFNEYSKTDVKSQDISREYSELDKQEKDLIDNFEKDPGKTTEDFMKFVNSNKPK